MSPKYFQNWPIGGDNIVKEEHGPTQIWSLIIECLSDHQVWETFKGLDPSQLSTARGLNPGIASCGYRLAFMRWCLLLLLFFYWYLSLMHFVLLFFGLTFWLQKHVVICAFKGVILMYVFILFELHLAIFSCLDAV